MLVKPQSTSPARIKVVGVGGGGGNAVNNMINNYDIQDVEFIAINTDAQALQNSQAEIKLKIGEEVTRGLGAGGNPAIGRKAAEESVDLVHENLAGADMVFITAGMGGGTGTGACPIVASVAKNLGALTVGIVTKPFTFEGKRRMDAALRGIDELKDKVDTLIVIPNQKLLEVIERNISFLEAMKRVDDVLAQAVLSISDLVNQAGMINVDFADVRSVMTNAGTALMGIGKAGGEERAREAANMAITSPLLELSIEGAKGVLFNVKGGNDLAMYEVDEAAKIIQDSVDPSANIIFGASIDPEMKDEIEITVLATGFDLVPGADSLPRINTYTASMAANQFSDVAIPPVINKQDVKPRPVIPGMDAQSGAFTKDTTFAADTNGDEDLETPSFMRRRKQF